VAEAKAVPGVTQAEAWGFTIGRYVRPDGSESDNLYLLAPPAGTELLDPPIIEGRSLRPGDTDAILVTPGLLANEPDLHLGSRMSVKIEGREQTYTIVGIMNMMGNSTIGYFTLMDYSAYTRHVREPNRANTIILTLAPKDLRDQGLEVAMAEVAQGRPHRIGGQLAVQVTGAAPAVGGDGGGGEQGPRDQPLPQPGQGAHQVLDVSPLNLTRGPAPQGQPVQPKVGQCRAQHPEPPWQARQEPQPVDGTPAVPWDHDAFSSVEDGSNDPVASVQQDRGPRKADNTDPVRPTGRGRAAAAFWTI
jgi:hypothetical protein